MLDTANRALTTGLAVLAAVLLLAIARGTISAADAAILLLRAAHVILAMVWVGLIWFINFIQMAALEDAREPDRKAILTWIAPSVGFHAGMAATLTFVSGALLLIVLGYITQRPLTSSLWLWGGVAGGTAMAGFVHAKIAPALRALLNPAITDPGVKAAARESLCTYVRINLLLAAPVTFAMLAGAHG